MIKGQDGITEMLNLPSLDEVLKQQGIDVHATAAPPPIEPDPQVVARTVEKLHQLSGRVAASDGTDHTDAMDELYREILGHARDLMAYGYNIDHPRARGIFEIAASMYGHAMSAVNDKREAQLKTLRLNLDKKKVDLEEKRTNHAIGQNTATFDNENTIIVEDRNELIKRLRSQMKS